MLYTVYRICQYYQVTTEAMQLFCDNKGALRNAFKPIKPGTTPYFTTDHDLVEVAQSLIKLIPIVITAQWVKGHYTGSQRKYQHTLNDAADKLAGDYQRFQHPHHTIRMPLAPPGFKVQLLHDSSVITSHVKQTLCSSLHNKPFEDYIIKKANWSLL